MPVNVNVGVKALTPYTQRMNRLMEELKETEQQQSLSSLKSTRDLLNNFSNATNINEFNTQKLTFSIEPNPFNLLTTISFHQEQKNITINLIDILGKKIKTLNFTGKQLTLEKEEMKSGIYFVQVIDENKNVINKKIVIQ